MTGPLSPSVLTDMTVSIEQHVEWITDCVGSPRERGLTSIEATPEAERDWVEHTAGTAARTLHPATDSWCTGADVPGSPRGFLARTGGADVSRARCDAVAAGGHEGCVLR
ncbi:hypothetical protein [Streptomyces uncialis]|uniref:hypothetical protein n=1 Tax=Streptomyces uncialis TaxID=1048205 RepID=UPI003406C0C1